MSSRTLSRPLLTGLAALLAALALSGCVYAPPGYEGRGYYAPGYMYAPPVVYGRWGWHHDDD